jgi:hypothetical protein
MRWRGEKRRCEVKEREGEEGRGVERRKKKGEKG